MLQTRSSAVRRRSPSPFRPAPGRAEPVGREDAARAASSIPYDLAARFELTGVPGHIVQDVVTIGPEADFTAVAISYGFQQDGRKPAGLRSSRNPARRLSGVLLGELSPQALLDGVRLNPRFEKLVFANTDDNGIADRTDLEFLDAPVPGSLLDVPSQDHDTRVLQRLTSDSNFTFLFSILDSTTGRELQDQPVHSIAALGAADGERPFKLLAKPVRFMPSSTIRVQVVERTVGTKGTLFIVLLGYRMLRTCPPVPAPPSGSRRVPFDYVAYMDLLGSPGKQVETEVPVCVDGGFTATAVGYGLEVADTGLTLPFPDRQADGSEAREALLGTASLSQLPLDALIDGFRVRRASIRFAFQNNGALSDRVPRDLAGRILERLNQPERVRFRYRLFDEGRGIELQNVAIDNIAGLGTASGERPFKQLAMPLRFLPRSSIRVTVDEVFGRGRLFIVLQGYRYLTDRGRS